MLFMDASTENARIARARERIRKAERESIEREWAPFRSVWSSFLLLFDCVSNRKEMVEVETHYYHVMLFMTEQLQIQSLIYLILIF